MVTSSFVLHELNSCGSLVNGIFGASGGIIMITLLVRPREIGV